MLLDTVFYSLDMEHHYCDLNQHTLTNANSLCWYPNMSTHVNCWEWERIIHLPNSLIVSSFLLGFGNLLCLPLQFDDHICITLYSLAPWPSKSFRFSSCDIIIKILMLKRQHGFYLVVHRIVFSIHISVSQVLQTKHFLLHMLKTCMQIFHVFLSPFCPAKMLCQ